MTDSSTEPRLGRTIAAYLEARALSLTNARTALGIGELDAKALLYLFEHPGTRPSTLRAYLGVTSAGVTTLADRLIARGAITRETDPQDRRATLLSVAVDLLEEPWSALTQFDVDIAASLHDCEPADQDCMTDAFERALAAAAAHALSGAK